MWANTWMGASTGLLSVGLDENVYIKTAILVQNWMPKIRKKSDLEAQKVVRLGFENLQTIVLGLLNCPPPTWDKSAKKMLGFISR